MRYGTEKCRIVTCFYYERDPAPDGGRVCHDSIGMENAPETDPAISDILYELAAREPIFHRAAPDATRADFERMIVDDFWEVGASGQCYDRITVLDVLEKRLKNPQTDVFETSGFHCRKLSESVYLLTYVLLQDGKRRTRRSTIWKRTVEGWKVVFHQGTIVDPGF